MLVGEHLFVSLVNAPGYLLEVAAAALGIVVGLDHLALGGGDGRLQCPRRVLLGVEVQRLERFLNQAYLVVVVVDDEPGVDADGLPSCRKMRAQMAWKVPMVRFLTVPADQLFQPLFHLPGGFVGEGDGHDAVRADADDLYQVSDAVGDDAGLAAARPGEDKHRAVDGFDGFFLGGIKFREDVHKEIIAGKGETLNSKL